MNCAVYVRTPNNQELAQNHQLEQFKTYCEKLGYSIQKDYQDTGNGLKVQLALQELQIDATTNKFDTVLVKDFTRISRNPLLNKSLIDSLSSYGVKVLSLDNSKSIN